MPRHCSICSSTEHTKAKCDAAEKARVAAEEKEKAERAAFAAETSQNQVLALYDMIIELRRDIESLREEMKTELNECVRRERTEYY